MGKGSFNLRRLLFGEKHPCYKGHTHPSMTAADNCNAHGLEIEKENKRRREANPYNCMKGCGHPTVELAKVCDYNQTVRNVGRQNIGYPLMAIKEHQKLRRRQNRELLAIKSEMGPSDSDSDSD